jgi:uncharacterized protein (TIGR02246 family)
MIHDREELAEQVGSTRLAFVDAVRARNATALAAFYTDDARLLAPSAELLRGREAIEQFWRAGLESGVSRVILQALETRPMGSHAYEIGRYELDVQAADGTHVLDRGRYLVLHRRDTDGAWRREVEMFHPERPPEVIAAQPVILDLEVGGVS